MKRKVYRPTTLSFVLLIFSSFTLVSLLVWGVLYLIFFFITGHNRYVNIPHLTDLTWDQAVRRLDDFDLEAKIYDSTNYNPSLAKYQVITTYPAGGKEVKRGRYVYLTINPSGYRKISVPLVANKTLREAVSILRASGFFINKLEYIDGKGRNVVSGIRYEDRDILEGEQLKKASEIDLVINKGVQGVMTSIPDVVGMHIQTAKDFLYSHSLNLRVLKKTSKSFGKIYRQYPKPGSFHPLGKRVDIWVE